MVLIDSLIELAKPWAKKIVEEKFLPYLQEIGYEYYLKGRQLNKLKSSMSDYLIKVKSQCSVINSLAFPNVLKKIKDIYEPLFLSSLDSRDENSIRISNGNDFITMITHALIIDNAGMGKSTLMKKIVIDTIDKTELIPIYIELRSLSDSPITNQIKELLGIELTESDDLIRNFPFAYFFDGVDEIPFDQKNNVLKRIRDFSDDFPSSKILITSRPDNSLLELHGFSRFRIKLLEIEQSYNLLRLYDANSYSLSNKLILSGKLISEIKSMRNKDSITEFLTTPLYVSLLFCAYKHKPIIPRRKDLFYSQVYEALFESHDLSKETGYVRGKMSGLDITDFSLLLRRLAFWCLKHNGRLEFSRAELEICILDIVSNIKGVQVKPIHFINDLITTVPLFVKEGSLYRWSHKSLMEYFSAEFICIDVKDKRDEILLKLFDSNSPSKYKNILELCADIDYSTFRRTVVKHCLERYLNHFDIIDEIENLSSVDKEIWASVSFFTDIILRLTPYGSASLSDFVPDIEKRSKSLDSELPIYGNTFIGYQDFITSLTYPESLGSAVFEILKWKHMEYFYTEKNFYNRLNDDVNVITENVMIKVINGRVVGAHDSIISGVITVLLQFRHALSIPVIRTNSARRALSDINLDASNGVDNLLDGF